MSAGFSSGNGSHRLLDLLLGLLLYFGMKDSFVEHSELLFESPGNVIGVSRVLLNLLMSVHVVMHAVMRMHMADAGCHASVPRAFCRQAGYSMLSGCKFMLTRDYRRMNALKFLTVHECLETQGI